MDAPLLPPRRGTDGITEDEAERRVAALRDDVARLLGELERRYHRAVELPRRIEQRGQEASAAVGRVLQRNKVPIGLVGLAFAGGVMVALGLRARRRRGFPERLRRAVNRVVGRAVSEGRAWALERSYRFAGR